MHSKTQKRTKVPAKASVVFKATRMFKPTNQTMDKFSKQKNKE